MNISQNFDVAIIGAGPGGSSAGYYLAKNGRRVLLLDKASFPRDKACGDGLTPRSIELLKDMGIFDELACYKKLTGVRVIMDMRSHRDSHFHDGRQEQLDYGYVVPRKQLDNILVKKAIEAGVTFWEKSKVNGAIWNGDRVCGVRLIRNGIKQDIYSTFVIAADGGNSYFARKIGLIKSSGRWSTGYAIRGYFINLHILEDLFRFYVPIMEPCGNRVLSGYGWVFPLSGASANIGVGYYPSKLHDFSVNLHSVFNSFMETLLNNDELFVEIKQIGKLQGAPLHSGMSPSNCVGPGVLLVGDAAGLVNPFTGEGISAALYSGMLAAQVLGEALSLSSPVEDNLLEYARLIDNKYRDFVIGSRKSIDNYNFAWKILNNFSFR